CHKRGPAAGAIHLRSNRGKNWIPHALRRRRMRCHILYTAAGSCPAPNALSRPRGAVSTPGFAAAFGADSWAEPELLPCRTVISSFHAPAASLPPLSRGLRDVHVRARYPYEGSGSRGSDGSRSSFLP